MAENNKFILLKPKIMKTSKFEEIKEMEKHFNKLKKIISKNIPTKKKRLPNKVSFPMYGITQKSYTITYSLHALGNYYWHLVKKPTLPEGINVKLLKRINARLEVIDKKVKELKEIGII